MMYVAVSVNKDNVLSFIVWNKELKMIHSAWNSFEDAKEAAADLNVARAKLQKLIDNTGK